MSGLEIAGIVLGAFPIAIIALDKYREMARISGFWWEIRSAHHKCSSELKFHNLNFNRNLKQLMLPLVATDTEIQALLADPGGVAWQQQDIAAQLEDRLQESYEVYLETIKQLQKTLVDINEELAIDMVSVQAKLQQAKTAKPQSDVKRRLLVKASRDFELYRLNFALGEAKRKELFAELKEYNERLEKLLTSSDTIAQLGSKSTRRSARSVVDRAALNFWRHADRLYRVLAQAWKCHCASYHQARYILQRGAEPEFLLLFLAGSYQHTGSASDWKTCETRIKLSDPPATDQNFSTVNIVLPSAKTASRAVPERSALSNPTSQGRVVQRAATPACVAPDRIQDLCRVFASTASPGANFGFLEDDHKRYHIQAASELSASCALDQTVTLHDLLANNQQAPLNRCQRCTLAVTIATSFLHLSGSGWLTSGSWSRNDISFLRDANNHNTLALHRPYFSKTFSTSVANADGVKGIPLLGILLLELCFGKLIDDHPARKQCGPGDAKTSALFDMLAAVEWLREVGGEAGPDYKDATEWCILGSRSISASEPWRQLLLEKVVQPLERCDSYLNPMAPKGIGNSRSVLTV